MKTWLNHVLHISIGLFLFLALCVFNPGRLVEEPLTTFPLPISHRQVKKEKRKPSERQKKQNNKTGRDFPSSREACIMHPDPLLSVPCEISYVSTSKATSLLW
jgi:hypothetical protein